MNQQDLFTTQSKPQDRKEYLRAYRLKHLEKSREWDRRFREQNHEEYLRKNRKYRHANREKIRKKQIESRKHNPDRWKNYDLKRLYNITLDEYKSLLANQENSCGICNAEFSSSIKPQVDHNHSTGKVRGLLCGNCNLFVDHVEKRPNLYELAMKYLTEYQ